MRCNILRVNRSILVLFLIVIFLAPIYYIPPKVAALSVVGVGNATVSLEGSSGGVLEVKTNKGGYATALVKREPHTATVSAYGHLNGVFNVDFRTTTSVELQLDNAPFIVGKVTMGESPVPGVHVSSGGNGVTDVNGLYAVPSSNGVNNPADIGFSPMSSIEGSRRFMEYQRTYQKFMQLVSFPGFEFNLSGAYGMFTAKDISLGVVGKQGKVTPSEYKSFHNVSLRQGFTINGYVTKGGAPISNAVVIAFAEDNPFYYDSGVTDENGYYVLSSNILANKNYTITVFAEGCALASKWVIVNGDMTVDFNLNSSVKVYGVVKDPNGNPLENFIVTFVTSYFPITVLTNESGGFYIDSGLGPGVYNVTFGPLNFMYGSQIGQVTLVTGTNNIELVYNRSLMVLTGTLDDPNRSELLEPVTVTINLYIAGIPIPLSFSTTLKSEGPFRIIVPYSIGYGGLTVEADQISIDFGSQYYYDKTTVATISPSSSYDLGTITLTTGLLVEVSIRVVSEPSQVTLPDFTHKLEGVYEGMPFHFTIKTNSSISTVLYQLSGGTGTIMIDLGGPTGTAGYLEITIPKEFMAPPYDVKIDSQSVSVNILSENSTHIVLRIGYTHSSHSITIESTNAIPEFPIAPITILTLLSVVVVVLLKKGVI